VRRIVENLQVEISDVHIILESNELSAGIMLESLNFETTDKYQNRTYVDRIASKESFLYKRFQIFGLGLYLDEKDDQTSRHKHSSLSPIKERDSNDLDENENALDQLYLLDPLSFEAKLRQADRTISIELPKYLFQSELNSLNILLSKTQVRLLTQSD
jgi:hypothetical protein